jgi:alpha-amylase
MLAPGGRFCSQRLVILFKLKTTPCIMKNTLLKGHALPIIRHTYKLFLALLLIILPFISTQAQSTRVKKVLFQGFWWDYWNSNFPYRWSNYLTELAPRLKSMGIDAVWIPPSYKNGSPGSVGYSPFDHYDLGDKYQKGGIDSVNVRTRMGNKDELLRLIAVLHANGIEVIQDVVLNHVDNAGSNGGVGGRDPQSPYSIASADGFKNFRYTSFSTPLLDDSQNDYWSRNGRWAKNYPNFYPNLMNNCNSGDICATLFGPDISYEGNAFGQSSNVPTSGNATVGAVTRPFFNPGQGTNYMRDNARNWIMWFKKQTGVDGWRWDAVKHFPIYVQEDLIYNTKYTLPAFAQGGEAMMCIGEWIGDRTALDNYVTAVRSGSEEHTGTFDFNLRGYGANGGLYSMVLGTGGFNMQNLPGEQQNKRFYNYSSQRVHRTIPFVNSHDTYRPKTDGSGNFLRPLGDASGWNEGDELGGNGRHIDPREPRLFSAYATVFAMDGNPTVFFEDLFDIGTTGKRYSHLPSNTTDLPVRPDIVNIMQAHQKLQFKNGDYAVPTSLTGAQAPSYAKGSSGDHLVLERTGRALIGITDKFNSTGNNTQDEEVWVSVSDPSWRNIDLYDYSGAHGVTTTRVFGDGRVLIKTAPVGHTIAGARGHGYSIWAPKPANVTFNTVNDMYNYLATYTPARSTSTTQEWEMADDLGDSHVKSLQQGGRLPANTTTQRNVGRIYVASGTTVTYRLFPEVNGGSQNIAVYNTAGTLVSQATGVSSNTAPLTGTYTATAEGWLSIRVRNSGSTASAQRVWVNVTYTAPATVNTRSAPGSLRRPVDMAVPELSDGFNWIYPNPTQGTVIINTGTLAPTEPVLVRILTPGGAVEASIRTTAAQASAQVSRALQNKPAGIYTIQLQHSKLQKQEKVVKID